MTVLPFQMPPRHANRGWDQSELEQMINLYSSHLGEGKVSAWNIAETELRDPQFFLLDATSNHDCVLSISRVGGTYVLEDGSGSLLGEDRRLASIMSAATRFLRPRGASAFVSRMLFMLCAARGALDEKAETLVPDYVEALAPLAAML